MATDLRSFMDDWLNENLVAVSYPADKVPDPEAARLAEQFVAEAVGHGFTEDSARRVFGDLPTFMHKQMEAAADAEVRRLAEKDD